MTTELALAAVESVDYCANGRTAARIRCPFCDCVVEARTWSLAGSGKRCECGAVLQGVIGAPGHRAVHARASRGTLSAQTPRRRDTAESRPPRTRGGRSSLEGDGRPTQGGTRGGAAG